MPKLLSTHLFLNINIDVLLLDAAVSDAAINRHLT
jgi:hypothetical protein